MPLRGPQENQRLVLQPVVWVFHLTACPPDPSTPHVWQLEYSGLNGFLNLEIEALTFVSIPAVYLSIISKEMDLMHNRLLFGSRVITAILHPIPEMPPPLQSP